MRGRSAVRLLVAAASGAVAFSFLSCMDGSGPGIGRASFSVLPHFESSVAGIVPLAHVRAVLARIPGGEVALDTVIDIAPEQEELNLDLKVVVLSANETFRMTLAFVDAQGDTVFRGGPIEVTANSSSTTATPVVLPITYVGVGADAASIEITTADQAALAGDTVRFVAVARRADGTAIPETPIAWRSATLAVVRPRDPAIGAPEYPGIFIAEDARGGAAVIAELLTGQSDQASVAVQPAPTGIVVQSGGGQSGPVAGTLPQPLVTRVVAQDGLGVSGINVDFATGSGSLSAASVVTNATGDAQVNWTFGNISGAVTVAATSTRVPGASAVFPGTANPGAATTVVVSPPTVNLASIGATQAYTAVVRDQFNNQLVNPALSWTSLATGVATINVSTGLATAVANGTATIRATSGTALGTATLTVGQVATQLAFVAQPTNTTAGVLIAPAVQVQARDANTNLVGTFTGNIAIAIGTNPGSSTLGGTVTIAAVAGVATFNNLTVSNAGTGYTLVASSGTLQTATSTTFNVAAIGGIIVADWSFDEGTGQTANDASGRGNHARLGQTTGIDATDPLRAAGRVGNALFFDGTDFISAANEPGFEPTAAVSIDAFVRGTNPGTFRYIVSKGGGPSDFNNASYALYTGPTGGLFFYVAPNGTTSTSSPGATPAIWDGNWHHVAGTWDGAVVRLFVDGTELGTGTNGGTIAYIGPTRNLVIGALDSANAVNGLTRNWIGGIDEVRVLSRALTPAEITARSLRGDAARLAFVSQPSSALPNASLGTITVAVQNGSGVTVTTDNTTQVTLQIGTNPAEGTLAGTATATAAAGIATFTGLSINNAGNGYTLQAFSTGLTSATSGTFNITSAGPATVFWTAAVSGNWSSGANWSTGSPPATGDNVVINVAGSYTVTLDVDADITTLIIGTSGAGGQTFVNATRTLSQTNGAVFGPNTTFQLSGGTVTGPGNVELRGIFQWSGGTLSGTGSALVTPTGGIQFSGAININRFLRVQGPGIWSGSPTVDGPGIVNEGSLDLVSNAFEQFHAGAVAGMFVNTGAIRKLGNGLTDFAIPFQNNGTIDLQFGSLQFSGSGGNITHAGDYVTAAGTLLVFCGDCIGTGVQFFTGDMTGAGVVQNISGVLNFLGFATFNGPSLVVAGGTVVVESPYASAGLTAVSGGVLHFEHVSPATTVNFALSGGQRAGPNTLLVSAGVSWVGGALSGPGTTRVLPSGSLALGAGNLTLDGHTLENGGTGVWSAPARVDAGNGATFRNLVSGTLSILGDVTLAYTSGSMPVFSNDGTMSIAGEEGSVFGVDVVNGGILDLQAGINTFTRGFTHADNAVLRGNGILNLTSATATTIEGDINPGTSPGLLSILGSLVQSTASAINIELGGTTVGSQYDRLIISGAATLTGAINVSLINGFTPAAGNQFAILTFDSRAGTLASMTLPTLPGGLVADTITVPGTGAPDTLYVRVVTAAAGPGRIVVSHDEWTLSDPGFSAAPTTAQFALNVAQFFTGGGTGNFLAYSGNVGLTGTALAATMTGAGHTWTVSTGVPFTLAQLQQYDGVFLMGTAADNQVLIDYVNGGGGVYLGGGTGLANEAGTWNTFLNAFGLGFNAPYTTPTGVLPITASHAIFAGVTSLYQGLGQLVLDVSAGDPRGTVFESGLYGVFDPTLTVGGAAQLAFTAQPTSAPQNASLGTIQVAIQDALGQTVTTDNSTLVTLTRLSGPTGAILGGTVQRTAVNGVASFPGLSLNEAGSYTLFASAGGLASAASGAFLVTPTGTTHIWTGAVNGDFETAGNWSPAAVPGAGNNIFIPALAPIDPVLQGGATVNDIYVENGAGLDLDGESVLTASGNIRAGTTITGEGNLVMTGSDRTLSGTVPVLEVLGTVTLAGDVTATGSVNVRGGLTIGSHTLSIPAHDIRTQVGGTITMTNPAGVIEASEAFFGGASTQDLLTAGVIRLSGDFTQNGFNSTTSFAPTGTMVVFNGAGTQEVHFGTPGLTESRFHDVTVEQGVVEPLTPIAMTGVLIVSGGRIDFNTVSGTTTIPDFNLNGGTRGGDGILEAGTMTWTSGRLAGIGATVVSAGGTLNISAGAKVIENPHTLSNRGTAVQVDAIASDGSGFLSNEIGAVWAFDGAINQANANTFTNAGTLVKTGPGDVQFGAFSNNNGIINVQSGNLLFQGSTTFNPASPTAGTIDAGASIVVNNPTLLFEFTNGFVFGGAGTFEVRGGTVDLPGDDGGQFPNLLITGGSINTSNTLLVNGNLTATGGTIHLDDRLEVTGSLTLGPGAVILGAGTVQAPLIVNGGSIVPRAGAQGTIEFEGDVTLLATGSLNIELDPNNGSDLIIVSGALTRGGALNVTLGAGYTPSLNDQFGFLWYGSATGAFDQTNLPPPAGGLTWQEFTTPGSPNIFGVAAILAGTANLWTNAAGGAWSNDANWSMGHPPTSGEDAVITLDGTYTVTLDQDATVASLTVGTISNVQRFEQGAHELSVSGTLFVIGVAEYALAGGTLIVGGDLDIGGRLEWSGGTISGPGTMFIANAGRAVLSGAAKTLSGKTLRNQSSGVITWTGGNIVLTNNANIINENGGGFIAEADGLMTVGDGTPHQFLNEGVFAKTGGTGFTSFVIDVINNGGINVDIGRLAFGGSGTVTHTGLFQSNGGGAMEFGGTGTHEFQGDVTGFTQVQTSNADLTFSAEVTLNNTLTVGQFGSMTFLADLGSVSQVTVDGDFVLTQGRFLSSETTWTVGGSGELTLDGAGQTFTFDRGLTIGGSGTLVLHDGLLELQDDGSYTVSNMLIVGGTLAITDDASLTVNGNLTMTGGTIDESQTGSVTAGGVVTIGAGALFQGSGSLEGAEGVTVHGTLNPGEDTPGPGTLDALGVLTFALTATLNIELGGTVAGSTGYDQLRANSIVRGGTLNVTLINGFTPALNDVFDLITYQSTSGSFTVNMPALGLGLAWELAEVSGTPSVLRATVVVSSNVWIGNGNWSDPGNWSLGRAPIATDQVVINLQDDFTVTLDVDATVASLTVGGPNLSMNFQQAAHTLTVNGPVLFTQGADYDLSGGTLVATGDVTIGEELQWSGGTIAGAGVLHIIPGATAILEGGVKTLSGKTFQNEGSITWTAGDLVLLQNASVHNLTSASIDVQDVMLTVGDATAHALTNDGVFVKSGGTGSMSLVVDAVNNGLMQANSGQFAFGGSNEYVHAGGFVGDPGAVLTFLNNGTHTLNGGVTGWGQIQANNAGVSFHGDFADNTTVSVGTGGSMTFHIGLGNTSNVTVAGELFLVQGQTLSNATTWNIQLGGAVHVDGPGQTFTLDRSIVLGGAGTLFLDNGTLVAELDGTFTLPETVVSGGTFLIPDPDTDASTVNITGNLTINGTGNVTIGTFGTVNVAQAFNTSDEGTINMIGNAVLDVNASASFSGGSTDGRLNSGTIRVGGNFTQTSVTDPHSFAQGAGASTILDGGSLQTLSFETLGQDGSHFGNLTITNESNANVAPPIVNIGAVVNGNLVVDAATSLTGTQMFVAGTATVGANATLGIGAFSIQGDLVVDPGATFNVLITALGDVNGTPLVVPDLPYQQLQIFGSRFANTSLDIANDLSINGIFNVNGQTITIVGNFSTVLGSGILDMRAGGDVVVGGNATWEGGDESTFLTAGEMRIAGTFAQLGTGNTFSSEGMAVDLESTNPQTISFANPGSGAGEGHFFDLIINNETSDVTFLTAVFANRQLIQPGDGTTLVGNGNVLTARGLQLGQATPGDAITNFNNLRLVVVDGAPMTQVNDAFFFNMNPAEIQVQIVRNNGSATFNNFEFDTAPTTGLYLHLDAPDEPFTLTMNNTSPTNWPTGTVQVTNQATLAGWTEETGGGPAAQLSFDTPPQTATEGATLGTIVVEIQDAGGNVVTTDNTTQVTLDITTGTTGAALLGTTTETAVAGVVTFTGLSIDSVGSGYSLDAASGGLTAATSPTFMITPTGMTHLWNGSVSNAFDTPQNWTPSTVPVSNVHHVFIPAGMPNQPLVPSTDANMASLYVEDGATLSIAAGGELTVHGSVRAGASITGPGTLSIQGAGTLSGTIPSVSIVAAVTLSGPTTVNGDVSVQTPGSLDLGSTSLTVTGTFETDAGLIMSAPGATLTTADAIWSGEASVLTAGTINVSGDFEIGGVEGSYLPTGTHRVVFTGTGTHTITFPAGATSFFNNVELSAGTVNAPSPFHVVGTFTMTNGILNLNGTSGPNTMQTFVMSGGTRAGPGDLAIGAAFTWNGGTLTGPAVTTVLPGATLPIAGSGTVGAGTAKRIAGGHTLLNFGTATWTGPGGVDAAISVGGASTLVNEAGATFTVSVPNQILKNLAGTFHFQNNGLIQATSGGIVRFFGGFTNAGQIQVTSGFFSLAQSSNPVSLGGTVTVTSPGTMDFHDTVDGTATLANGLSVTGTGAFEVRGGTVTLAAGATVDVERLTITDGTAANDPMLVIPDATLNVNAAFTINTRGAFTMNNALSALNVTGNAAFGGLSTDGLLTDGTISVAGNFTQTTGLSSSSFAQTGGTTVLNGVLAQTVSFEDPGDSHFGNLQTDNTGAGVTFSTDAFAQGQLRAANQSTATLTGTGGSTLTVQGLDATDVVISNLPLVVESGAPIATFDQITFQDFAATVNQLSISRPSGTFTFNDLVFSATPPDAGFFYINLFGTSDQLLRVTLTAATPGTPAGGSVNATDGGASLTSVVWNGLCIGSQC